MDLSQPKRQSPVAILIFIFVFLKRLVRGLWAIVLFFFIGKRDEGSFLSSSIGLVAILLGAGTLVMSLLSYLRYYYFIEEDALNIHRGVFNRQKVNLPFERIQNINFEQKPVHQFFGVVRLQIDTAGSSNTEIKIDALPREDAEAVRDYILERKRHISPSTEDGEPLPLSPVPEPDQLLLHLTPLDLMKVGISQNHLRTAAIIIGIGFGFLGNIEDLLGIDMTEYAVENADRIGYSVFMNFLIFLIVLLLVSFVATSFRTVLRYFNLRFHKSKEGFRLSSGLLTRQEVALRREKVQIIRWGDNPLRRIFGIYTLGIRQAASGETASRKKAVEVPGCYLPQVEEVLYSCFPDAAQDVFRAHSIHKAFVWRRFIYLGIIPMLVFLGLFLVTYHLKWAVLMLSIPPLVLGLLLVFHKKYRLDIGKEYMRTTRGLFATSYSQLPFYKVQTVSIVQSYYQRRKSLANVTIYTAGGSVTIPFLDLAKARALQNYILYKVESSSKAWM